MINSPNLSSWWCIEIVRRKLMLITLGTLRVSVRHFNKTLESFRFWDEDDYENEIFSILSSARAWTNVILAAKCDSHRHSTTSFSENVVVAEASYLMLEILSFGDRERALPPSTEISVLTFMVKKVQWCFPGCLFLENRKVNLKLNVVRVFRALYFARKPVVV